MWEWIKLIAISILVINVFIGLCVWRIYIQNKDKIIVIREEDYYE